MVLELHAMPRRVSSSLARANPAAVGAEREMEHRDRVAARRGSASPSRTGNSASAVVPAPMNAGTSPQTSA